MEAARPRASSSLKPSWRNCSAPQRKTSSSSLRTVGSFGAAAPVDIPCNRTLWEAGIGVVPEVLTSDLQGLEEHEQRGVASELGHIWESAVAVPPKDDTLGHKASEVLRSPSRVRDVPHLREGSHSFERHRLDLTHAFACDCEAAADLLERLRLAVAEAVAEDQHLSLSVFQEREHPNQRLAPERVLHLLLG